MNMHFSYDSKLIRTLNTIADLMILNVLTILCSIPIVTLGASVTALYDAVWRMQEDESKVTRAFFKAFKSNFKKSTILWLIYLPLGILLLWSLNRSIALDTSLPNTLLSLLGAMWWCFGLAWVFPLQARFENTVWGTFKNSILFPMGFFPRTFAMAFFNVLPWVLLLTPDTTTISYFVMGGILWLLIYFSLAAYINLKLLGKPYSHFYAQAAAMSETNKEE